MLYFPAGVGDALTVTLTVISQVFICLKCSVQVGVCQN